MNYPRRRLVIVVRADPVICGHSGEARNLAEVALRRGFTDVRLLTWPIPVLQAVGLPLKPLCRPDCLGLCPRCGTNLNASNCACAEERTEDPRLRVLKNLL